MPKTSAMAPVPMICSIDAHLRSSGDALLDGNDCRRGGPSCRCRSRQRRCPASHQPAGGDRRQHARGVQQRLCRRRVRRRQHVHHNAGVEGVLQTAAALPARRNPALSAADPAGAQMPGQRCTCKLSTTHAHERIT